MNVMHSLRHTTVRSLGAVTATADGITSGVTSLADLAAAGAAHARHYRLTTEAALDMSTDEFEAIAVDNAKLRISRAQKAIRLELREDPELEAIYNAITFTPKSKKPALSVAAE